MKQHRFDKDFQEIMEAVNEVYYESYQEDDDISDEELEEYYSNFSDKEVEEKIQKILTDMYYDPKLYETDDDIEEGVKSFLKRAMKEDDGGTDGAEKKDDGGTDGGEKKTGFLGNVVKGIKQGLKGVKGPKKDKEDKEEKPKTKTSLKSKIGSGYKAFKKGAGTAKVGGFKAGLKTAKRSYKSSQGHAKRKAGITNPKAKVKAKGKSGDTKKAPPQKLKIKKL